MGWFALCYFLQNKTGFERFLREKNSTTTSSTVCAITSHPRRSLAPDLIPHYFQAIFDRNWRVHFLRSELRNYLLSLEDRCANPTRYTSSIIMLEQSAKLRHLWGGMVNEHPRANQRMLQSFDLSASGCDYQRILRFMTVQPRGLNPISSLYALFFTSRLRLLSNWFSVLHHRPWDC